MLPVSWSHPDEDVRQLLRVDGLLVPGPGLAVRHRLGRAPARARLLGDEALQRETVRGLGRGVQAENI